LVVAAAAEQQARGPGRRGARAGRQIDRGIPTLRRVAQADVRAALQPQLHVQPARRGRAAVRNLDAELAPVDLLFSEVLVLVDLALGKLGRAERDAARLALEAEAVPVQVVAVECREVEGQTIRIGFDRVGIRLLRRQDVGVLSAERGERTEERERTQQRGQRQAWTHASVLLHCPTDASIQPR
jgi:hypothetical protein